MRRRRIICLIVFYVGLILILTLRPYVFSAEPEHLARFLASVFAAPLSLTRDSASNIVLFVPLGVLLYPCLRRLRYRLAATILIAGLVGGALSFTVELLQVFFARDPAVSDICANTLGTVCGAWLSALWPWLVRSLVGPVWDKLFNSTALLVLVLIYGGIPFVLSVLHVIEPFRLWNSRFTFQVGNEATLDNPWLGEIRYVAVYNRALSREEISERFKQGKRDLTAKASTKGIILLYTFNERAGSIVRDVSNFGIPLDLVALPPNHTRWLDSSNGIEISKPAILRSREPGAKLIEAIRATNEFSIEVWVTPKNALQQGPARIVSLSSRALSGNFILGQTNSDIQFRVRTAISGASGAGFALTTTNGFLTPNLHHIVATYREGVQRMYANGVEQAAPLDLTKNGIVGLGVPKSLIGFLAYAGLYFGPVSFFYAVFYSTRAKTGIGALLVSIVVTTALLSMTEIFQAFIFDRGVDSWLILCGLAISAVMAIAGVLSSYRDYVGFGSAISFPYIRMFRL